MDKKCIAFYSWQDDLPSQTNKNAIRKSLDKAKKELAKAKLTIEIDEATRDEAGSPNIPQTILKKITKADIFICDVSIINATSKHGRKVPNPNVVFELGYAVSELGWERIILLFNTAYGTHQDLPFDFKPHRATSYHLNEGEQENLQPLINELKIAIRTIIVKDPAKPPELRSLSPEETKRERDIENLKEILLSFHVPSLEYFIMDASLRIRKEIFVFWEGFNGIIQSDLFYIYDEKLRDAVMKFHECWEKTLLHGNLFAVNFNGASLRPPSEGLLIEERQKEIDEMFLERYKLGEALKNLQRIIRENYLEIHPGELSERAMKDYLVFSRENSIELG